MSRSVRAALFDVDGTLVDTNYLHAVTWWEAFAQAGLSGADGGHPPGDRDGLGPDARHVAPGRPGQGRRRGYSRRAQHSLRHVLVPAAAAARGGGPAARMQAPRPGGGAGQLGRRARVQGAARRPSTPRTRSTRPRLPGTSSPASPRPDLVEVALEGSACPAAEAVFTGDTVWDVRACRKAGVPCIGLLSGGISGDELTAAGAAEVYAGPADLLGALRGSMLGRRDAGQPVPPGRGRPGAPDRSAS